MSSKLLVVAAALAGIASASDLFSVVGLADGVEECGTAREGASSPRNLYNEMIPFLLCRCFKIDVDFDNAGGDSFTLGSATFVRQEDGSYAADGDGGVATLEVGEDGEGNKTLYADFDVPHSAEYEIKNCGPGCHVVVMVHNYQRPE